MESGKIDDILNESLIIKESEYLPKINGRKQMHFYIDTDKAKKQLKQTILEELEKHETYIIAHPSRASVFGAVCGYIQNLFR